MPKFCKRVEGHGFPNNVIGLNEMGEVQMNLTGPRPKFSQLWRIILYDTAKQCIKELQQGYSHDRLLSVACHKITPSPGRLLGCNRVIPSEHKEDAGAHAPIASAVSDNPWAD